MLYTAQPPRLMAVIFTATKGLVVVVVVMHNTHHVYVLV
jgi:hypothetical protein